MLVLVYIFRTTVVDISCLLFLDRKNTSRCPLRCRSWCRLRMQPSVTPVADLAVRHDCTALVLNCPAVASP